MNPIHPRAVMFEPKIDFKSMKSLVFAFERFAAFSESENRQYRIVTNTRLVSGVGVIGFTSTFFNLQVHFLQSHITST